MLQKARSELPTVPSLETPLSRLLAHGPGALSDGELLALILSAELEASVLVATTTLVEEHGLSRLLQEGFSTLRTRVSETEAARLMAVYEVAVRLTKAKIPDDVWLTRPREVVRYLHLRYGGRREAVVGALFLDERNRLLAEREFFRGSARKLTAETTPILRAAILAHAAGMVLFGTHPSGDPAPSEKETWFNLEMRHAAETVGVSLRDHILIAGPDHWHSFHCERYPAG